MPSAILTWHSLDTSGSPISIAPAVFARQLQALAQSGINIVPLSQILSTPNAIALTFDDGFQNFLQHALPFLQHHNFPATLFAVSEFVGKDNHWPGQPSGIPKLPLLNWEDLNSIHKAGISIGAHTATHPTLYKLPFETQRTEIVSAKQTLEDKLGIAITEFAYPYGATDARSHLTVQRNFATACTTEFRHISRNDVVHLLPRIDVRSLGHPVWLSSLLTPAGETWTALRRSIRFARSAA